MHTLLRLIAGVAISLCAVVMAHAQTSPLESVLRATSITDTSRAGSGISGQLNAVLIETERRSYHNARVTISGATLGAAARAGMRGVSRFVPYVGLALTAAELAGWQREGDWFNHGDGIPREELPTGEFYACFGPETLKITGLYCMDYARIGTLRSWAIGQSCETDIPSTVEVAEVVDNSPSDKYVRITCKDAGGTVRRITGSQSKYNGLPDDYKTPGSKDPTPVTDSELLDAILNQGPQTHFNLLHDVNGNPHLFPEVMAALNSMASSIGANSGNTPNVDGDPVNPDNTNPNDPSPPNNPKSSELPAFCEWAAVVCEFIDWYKDEGKPLEPVELPEAEEEDPTQTWSSGQSGGSCPAPVSTSVMGSEVAFSYQPICDFATMLRGVLLLAAAVSAAYIIAGAARE